MPLHLHLDPNDPSTYFTYTPDSEIVTMYENGLALPAIVRAVMWQDGIKKKSVAQHRVSGALMQHHLGGVRIIPAECPNHPFSPRSQTY